jgi:sulfotransferase family protein
MVTTTLPRPAGGGATRIPLVYILAASHSGSTLLAMLLGRHPHVCTVGELKATSFDHVDRYPCSCRTTVIACPFWAGISQLMQLRGFDFNITDVGTDFSSVPSRYARWLLQPLYRGPLLETLRDVALACSPTWRFHLSRAQLRNVALAESICAHSGKRVIIDSSKTALRLKYLLLNPRFEVRVVRLVRDGRAVALTYTDPATFADATDPALRGGGTGAHRDRERLSLQLAAREWRRSNEEAEAILPQLASSQWIQIRYETLCTRPDATLRELFTFIGVDPVLPSSDPCHVEHHIIGNGMRLDVSLQIRLDERWKSVLDNDSLRIFHNEAGRMNRRLGYR